MVTAKSYNVAARTAEPRRVKTTHNSQHSKANHRTGELEPHGKGTEVLPLPWSMKFGNLLVATIIKRSIRTFPPGFMVYFSCSESKLLNYESLKNFTWPVEGASPHRKASTYTGDNMAQKQTSNHASKGFRTHNPKCLSAQDHSRHRPRGVCGRQIYKF
jgi:hypothetical protein